MTSRRVSDWHFGGWPIFRQPHEKAAPQTGSSSKSSSQSVLPTSPLVEGGPKLLWLASPVALGVQLAAFGALVCTMHNAQASSAHRRHTRGNFNLISTLIQLCHQERDGRLDEVGAADKLPPAKPPEGAGAPKCGRTLARAANVGARNSNSIPRGWRAANNKRFWPAGQLETSPTLSRP